MSIGESVSFNIFLFSLAFGFLCLAYQTVILLLQKKSLYLSPVRGQVGYGVYYALSKGMLPWNKESGRLHPVIFWSGVLFHCGVFLVFFYMLLRALGFQSAGLSSFFFPLILLAALVGVVNLIRRFFSTEMKAYTVRDDYISLALSTLVLFMALGYSKGAMGVLWLDLSVALLFIYLPFSKIKHMVTFFFARKYHGEHFGLLGLYTKQMKYLFGKLDSKEISSLLEEPTTSKSEPVLTNKISEEKRIPFVKGLKKHMSRHVSAMVNSCVHCGMCTESCHYYMSTNDPHLIPVAKLDKLTQLYRHQFDPFAFSALNESTEATISKIEELHETAFMNCSICGRCALSCPMGINTGEAMMVARRSFSDIGESPEGLEKPAQTAVSKGNYLGLPVDDVVDNIEWLSEELAEDLEISEEEAQIPVDQKSSDVLYIPHPLELRDFPMIVLATVKIFHKAGIKYTLSSHHFDTVNYAYYSGNQEAMRTIIENLIKAQQEVGAKEVVLSPCGHGYKVLRWEAEKLLGQPFDFKILSLGEAIDKYYQEGKIQLNKDVLDGKLTYHDPCNIGRNGGVIDEPRRVINALSSRFVEMAPSGAFNFCCGGGGGLSASANYGQTRLKVGATKAKQIKDSEADWVITNCFNCNTQIKEIQRKYKLDYKVKSIAEVVADSLI